MGNKLKNAKYDQGYKKELSKKNQLIHFLRKYVNAPWTSELKPENITLCDKEFILQDFEMRESDLVFKITLNGQTFYLYLLMELQSSTDFTMPFRLLIYMTNLWLKIFQSVAKEERERKDFKLPVILPIVFHNGDNRWTPVTQFSSYQRGAEDFKGYALDFKYYLVDLSLIDQGDILSTNTLIDNIMALDQSRSGQELLDILEILQERIKELPKGDQADFILWLEHVLKRQRFQEEYIENVVQFMKKGGFDNMITYGIERVLNREREEQKRLGRAEGRKQGRQEGREQGRQEGRQQGRQEGQQAGILLVKKLLSQYGDKEIPPETIAEVYGISLEDAKALLENTEE